jgi:NDP-sugar pyrophosphorylase family protein
MAVNDVVALLMAGGRSERMRATLGSTHKALVPLLGVTLFERNLVSLISQGFTNITVAVSEHEPEVQAFVKGYGRDLAQRYGADLKCLTESTALGNIGAARKFRHCPGVVVLVSYVDNLSTLDLNAMISHHKNSDAEMTVAVHRHTFSLPFGEVIVNDGLIREYLEKPRKRYMISSGYFVVSSRACDRIPEDTRVNVVDFFEILRSAGLSVSAFEHEALWIDINDAAGVKSAERLLRDHKGAFERIRDMSAG